MCPPSLESNVNADHAPEEMGMSKLKVWLPTIRTKSGTDFFTIRLAEGLRRHGIDVVVSWFPHAYELAPYLLSHISPPLGTDVIHANSWHGAGFHRSGIPLVVTVHHVVFDPEYCRMKTWARSNYHELLIRPYERLAFKYASAITAVSKFSAKCAQSYNAANHVECIYNWVDTQFFRPEEQNNQSDKFSLLFVGNPTQHKGADLFEPIMNELGDGYELYYTSNPETRPFSAKNMHALGRLNQTEIFQAYRQCDALLFPTRGEAAPYAVIEAMACGKPVITSRNSALPEYVADGNTGFLCSTGNTSEFVQAIRKLKGDKSICAKMGRAGRERVLSLFLPDNSIDSYINLYKRLKT